MQGSLSLCLIMFIPLYLTSFHQLPPALLMAKFVFVREDAALPSLAPLYHGPYLVLKRRVKFFCLQLGSRTDVVSLDWLKLAFSKDPITAVLSPALGWPALHSALPALAPPPSPLSTFVPFVRRYKERGTFSTSYTCFCSAKPSPDIT